MSRRPLLPLLALAALLALLPACRALSCYECEDPLPSDHPLRQSSIAGMTVPPCAGFDSDDDKFKMDKCDPGIDEKCVKVSWSGGEKRACADSSFKEGCTVENGNTFCACSTDYCNSAGLTTPALLLLLPAALLAALYAA